jgi:acetylornithine deacetylase/succinyl-diaminopimelate desuccinylase-like protein
MIDLRLWRIVLLAVPVALVVGMFSLQEVPHPAEPALPPDAFEGEAAEALARDLAREYPSPRPGSAEDEGLGEAVLERFKEISSIEVSEQRFTGDYDGDEVELRNLIGILPGPSERQVAVMAHRDVIEGTGAASTIASTAALLEIASTFAGSTHEKTLVFVSTDGGSIGALGARRFARDYSDAALLDAVIVLSQPAADNPVQPLMVPWSTGTQSTSIRLAQTAASTVSSELDMPSGDESPLSDVLRLALPSALGEQGPLVQEGFDSVRLSSSGELPPPAAEDTEGAVDAGTLGRFGRATLSLMLAVDVARDRLEHGPGTYIGLAGNLLPGWTLALLALALLLPPAAVGFGGLAVTAGSPWQALRAIGWVAWRAVPMLIGFALLMLGALVGLIPSPEFPFVPGSEALGLGGTAAVVVATLAFAVAAFLLRPLLPPPPGLARLASPAAISMAALAGFGIWLVNPYLALLVAVGLQLWVLAAAGIGPGRLAAAGWVLVGLLPALAAVAALAGRFDAGAGVVEDLLYMFTGGQLSNRLGVLVCLLLAAGVALVAARGEPRSVEQFSLRAMVARGRELGRERERGRPPEAEDEVPEEPQELDEDGRLEEPPPEEPARDPRMWSKPPASISLPSSA